MRKPFREREHGERLPRQQHLLERAVGVVGAEQEFEPEQRGEQRRDPERAAGDLAQLAELRAERQRKECRDHDEEDERLRDLAPVAQSQQEIAPVGEHSSTEDAGLRRHASSSRRGT